MSITSIVTRQIADLAITTAKIAANAITLAKFGWASAKGDILGYDGSAYHVLAVGSDGQVLTADAASTNGIKWAASAGGGGGATVLSGVLGADVGPVAGTNVGTAFTVAIASNSTYLFDVYLVLDASSTSTAKLRITLPAGATLSAEAIGCTSTTSTIVTVSVTSAFGSQGYGSTTTTAGSRWVRITGTIVTGVTAGNFVLDFSINTVTANTVTAKTGSGYVFNKV